MEFKHYPVMLKECIDGLNLKADSIIVDGTLGGAGHSSEILKHITNGLLIGIDKDEEALKVSSERLKKIASNFKLVHSDFKDISNVLFSLNIENVDGILLDLGVSSYQLDNAERGFSYLQDSSLDMRMDRTQTFCAKDVVNGYKEEQLSKLIYEYGDEPFARKIAREIVKRRTVKQIETTAELNSIVEYCYPAKIKNRGGAVAKKTFQAIRIEVNGELTNLKNALIGAISKLKKGGRLCVITFHSLEDRIAKTLFKEMSTNCICPPEIPICVCHHKAEIKLVNRKVITPTEEELKENKRSHSAKLRIIEKL